jgi:NADH-quinone oxidoreductase subunit N
MLMLPEITVIITAMAVLVADLFLPERLRRGVSYLSLAGLAAAAVVLLAEVPMNGSLLGGQFGMDSVAWWFKLFFLVSGFFTVVLSMDLLHGRAKFRMRGIGSPGEYYTVLLLTICGMMFLVSARDMVLLYVSLELATIPLFALAAWRREDMRSGEAGLKYVIIGALASAFILYGLGLLYGLTGQIGLDAARVAQGSPAFWLAVAMLVAGVGFKLTLVPFHLWAADVFEGAPMPITAFLSVASKGTGLAFMFQLFFRMMGGWLDDWSLLIALFAAVTMTLGNCVAIVQHNIKRFMAFSAISHAGVFIMGFLGPHDYGVPAMLFYLLAYIASSFALFAGIVWYSNETGRECIRDYRGLSRTNPMMALAMMLALFSLAGIPPLSGFVGKFFLFSVAAGAGFHWLVGVAAVNSTIGLYNYLRIVREMYIEPVHEGGAAGPASWSLSIATAVLTVVLVLVGIIPFFYNAINASTIAWMSTVLPH